MTQSLFQIAMQIAPESPSPYFIMETLWTSDGPRTRICDGRWKSTYEIHREAERRGLKLNEWIDNQEPK